MNLTLSLVAGLTLLLPGLSALAAWNFKGAVEGAPGAEIPLTSVNGLVVVVGISAILHLAGYWLAYWIWAAVPAFSTLFPNSALPRAAEPYQTLWQLVAGAGKASGGAAGNQLPPLEAVAELGLAILALCAFAIRVASSRLLDVVLDGRDTRSLGWVYQNVIRPRRNGYEPFAYVLTVPAQGEFGIGYQGMVADIRQGPDGQVKSICLSEPEAFVYEIAAGRSESARKISPARGSPRVRLHQRRWLGGVVALEAAVIRNIVVHHIPTFVLDELSALNNDIGTSQ